eukprot:6652081-Heterocapsa_arctica.AAC.1
MHNMRQVLYSRPSSNIQNGRLQSFWAEHKLNLWHGLCRDIPCMNQDHHDTQWKYTQQQSEFNINMDGDTRDLLAEII